MAHNRVVEAEPEDERVIEVSLGSEYNRGIEHDPDPFAKKASELNEMEGLSRSFKISTTKQLQKFYRGVDGAASKKEETEDVTGYNAFKVMLPPYNLDYLAKLYEVSPPHYSAVKAKVANIVGLGYDFILSPNAKMAVDKIDTEAKTKKMRARLEVEKQKLFDWIASCNEEDDFIETLIKVWTDYEVTGNGYLEIGRTTSGSIGYIGHVPATTMRIRQRRDGFVQIISNKAVFFRNFGDQKTPNPVGSDTRPNEVIHIKKYSPTNGFYGVPDVVAAKAAVAGNEFATRFNLDYFENKAVPRYVIVIKGGRLSPAAERRITEFFQTSLKGKNHRTLYVPLPPDEQERKTSFEMKPVEAGTQDSSFNNYRKGNLSDILMAHRVPLSKVGLAEGVSLAVARDADKTFKEQVCRPEQTIFENKLNKIIKEVTDVFLIHLNELSLTDEDTQSKIDERYIRNQVVVPNEIRARKGMPGLDGGDKVVQQGAQANAEARAQTNQTRGRDAERSANSPDRSGEARQPKGEGRATS
ncbi:portal protein [Streptomyces phage Coruscant]|uniref:Portal protein n=1 Tax=Streptomyces phage Coruscant TaxID=2739834 RepID=A0A7G4AVY9_9CAUD|nr:portal protein [Streptomyces phage Coruscant]QMP84179.1 portal protein [Streptomyces phage Coruscant]